MMILIGGVSLIAGMLIASMSVPIGHYLKRDGEWMRSNRTREDWYRIVNAD